MKLSLIFINYNKEQWIVGLLESWIGNLSGKHDYEILVVFDDCKDRSVALAAGYLDTTHLPYRFLFADDRYELYCSNYAASQATGDYLVFIQDDNWMFDKDWDAILLDTAARVERPGCIGFLAGLRMLPMGPNGQVRHERIESPRPMKCAHDVFGSQPGSPLGIWQVDAICRPFAISRKLLLRYGMFDLAFSPTCGDDLDLSLKLLFDGYANTYIPFDVLNVSSSTSTMTQDFIDTAYRRTYYFIKKRYGKRLNGEFATSVRVLSPCPGEFSPVASAQTRHITILSVPGPFTGVTGAIQKTAVQSWLRLTPRPDVILFGQSPAIYEAVEELGVFHIPYLKVSDAGSPLLPDLFLKAGDFSRTEILAFVQPDMVLDDAFLDVIEKLDATSQVKCLVHGQALGVAFDRVAAMDGMSGLEPLKAMAAPKTVACKQSDYCVFHKAQLGTLLEGAPDTESLDDWLVDRSRQRHYPVVNASNMIFTARLECEGS